jgi:hypothetical protein
LTSTRRSSPCKAFGHTAGRYRDKYGYAGPCKRCGVLRSLIAKSMLYWFARLILELSGERAGFFANGQTPEEHRVYRNRYRRIRYRALRASGLSVPDTQAILNATTAKEYLRRHKQCRDAYKRRWGGYPMIGTAAWVRRETHKLAEA